MIYLLTLFCSLCINFAYIEPYNMLSNNQSGVGQQYINELRSRIASNYAGYYSSTYGWIDNVPDEDMVVVYGDTLWGSYQSVYQVLVPLEGYNQSASSISCNAYTYTNDIVDSVTINFNNYVKFWIGGGNYVDSPYVAGYKTYTFNANDNYRLVYCYKTIYCNETLVINTTDNIIGWEGEGVGIGSLGGNGHSSGGSPSDILNNDGVTWSSPSPALHSTGHSVGVSSSSATFDFTNAMQNLLGQLVDNANDIIGNLSGIGSILGGMSNNIIQGASAIFNGISTFNNNVNGFLGYLTEIPSFSDIVDALQSEDNIGALYDLSQQIDIFSEIGLTQVSSAPTYTFNFSGTMFDYVNNITLDFSFLDSTKSIWQTLLIALLYFNLLVTILVGLPDLIQGRGGT